MSRTFYITTPLYYVNAPPHLGGTYTTIVADTISRYKRMMGFDVKLFCGTDEHGQKIERSAKAQGIDPKSLADRVYTQYVDLWKRVGIEFDEFVRTTEPRHHVSVQELYRRCKANGYIYKGEYSGWYCVSCEAYAPESDPSTPANCPDCGRKTEWFKEESYFFKLSAWGERLLKFYEEHPEFIQPSYRKNEVISFVKSGLMDLSISRTTFNWGVPVPGNDKHVMYVWVDALTNYISALGYPDVNSENFKKFWPADVHVVGKDILRFHAVYWPAFLMSAGVPTPKTVFAHGWWMSEGQKMSKSLGNVVTPENLIGRYGMEQSRYLLLREVAFGNDGNLSHESAVNRINAELANNLGNLVQRTLSMINKNCEGKVPSPGVLEDADKELLQKAGQEMLVQVRGEFEKMQFSKAIEEFITVSHAANLYIDAQAPWTLKKTNPARMATVLYVLAEVIRNLGLIIQPFTPMAAQKMLDQVAVAANERDFSFIGEKYALKAGTPLPAPSGVFPRILDEAKTA